MAMPTLTPSFHTNKGNLKIGALQIDDCQFSKEVRVPMKPFTTKEASSTARSFTMPKCVTKYVIHLR